MPPSSSTGRTTSTVRNRERRICEEESSGQSRNGKYQLFLLSREWFFPTWLLATGLYPCLAVPQGQNIPLFVRGYITRSPITVLRIPAQEQGMPAFTHAWTRLRQAAMLPGGAAPPPLAPAGNIPSLTAQSINSSSKRC